MAWREETPETLDALFSRLRTIAEGDFFCRGQATVRWKDLAPSLVRTFPQQPERPYHAGRLTREIACVVQFRKYAMMHLSPAEVELVGTYVGAMVVMQHYGGPTRLLDWSLSPWVAAYFAVNEHPGEDGVIWVVDREMLIDNQATWEDQYSAMTSAEGQEEWAKAAIDETPAVCQVYSPLDTPRMSSQQSVATMGGSLCVSQDVCIEKMLVAEHRSKIIIKSKLKDPVLKQLHGMNINFYSLFGGPFGAAKHILESVARNLPMAMSRKLSRCILSQPPQGTSPVKENPS